MATGNRKKHKNEHGQSILTVVVRNSCGELRTYNIDGATGSYIGKGDFHERDFDHLEIIYDFDKVQKSYDTLDVVATTAQLGGSCKYFLKRYPTKEFRQQRRSLTVIGPFWLSFCVAAVFFTVGAVSICYDFYLHRQIQEIGKT